MASNIYAVVRRNTPDLAQAGSRGTPHLEHGRQLASFGFDQNDAPAGTVTFYEAAVAPAAGGANPATAPADEIVPATEGCVQRLLADGVAALAASTPAFDESDEPVLPPPGPGKKVSAGIVPVDEQGRLTIREPTNHFGGYKHTFAKGRLDPDETPRQAAHRELFEETGLHARIVGLVGDFDGDTGVTRLYVGVRAGGVETLSAETQAINTVGPLTALDMLNRQRDKDALLRLIEIAASAVDWTWPLVDENWRCSLNRRPHPVYDPGGGRVACYVGDRFRPTI